MEYLIIPLTALFASGLTLFSGFGLGTILLPIFALFFPVEVAIAMTAIVHLLNNLFKVYLVGRFADKQVVLKFGGPAILAAFAGAWVLLRFSNLQPLLTYRLDENEFFVTPIKLTIAVLIIVFASLELTKRVATLSFDRKWLPLGGVLSGFFGGLSGHQGALRSAFLLKTGLSKEGFIGTGVVIACAVDVARLLVYSSRFAFSLTQENTLLLTLAIVAAFAGASLGARLLKKVTLRAVQILVSTMLFGIAFGLGTGLI